jgi:hypothetical protein
MRSRRVALLSLAILVLAACQDQSAPTDPLHFTISDGAHGGNAHFYFLPPLVPAPTYTGTFDGTRSPVVDICPWDGIACGPSIATFTMTTGPGSETVRVADEHYIVNWHTDEFPLITHQMYRITVSVGGTDLGYADVVIAESGREAKSMTTGDTFGLKDGRTMPIKFRIEEGYDPIGELTPQERAKISPVLLEQFTSQDVIEPVEALINVLDDQIPLPDLTGVEVLTDYRPTLAKAFVRISDAATLASLVQSNNIEYVHENKKYYLFSEPWQEITGQNLAELSGYTGAGTAVAILDDGGREIGFTGGKLPNDGVIDLSVPAFGGCTDVGTPASCRVVAEENPYWGDPHWDNHATYVAMRVALTAPGADVIGWDVGFDGAIGDNEVAEALRWVLDHHNEYNIVAVNMSFGSDADGPEPAGPFSTTDCPTGNDPEFLRLREAGIMPIAGAGNDGVWQTNNDAFFGISHPACSPFVVSVGGSDGSGIWIDGKGSTRGPNLDLLAPACGDGGCGTSLAAPIVAGAWAILRAALPALSLEQTQELLKTTGRPISDHNGSGLTFRRIQLARALLTSGIPVVAYDNGASTHSGGSAVGQFIAADDFSLPIAATVTGASVDVSDGPASQNRRWDGTVEWWLFDRPAGSIPYNLIASGTGVNVVQGNIVEDSFGNREFTVDFDFGQEIALPEGDTYFLALHMQADYSRVSVVWDYQGSTVAYRSWSGGQLVGGVPNFTADVGGHNPPYDYAFRVWAK